MKFCFAIYCAVGTLFSLNSFATPIDELSAQCEKGNGQSCYDAGIALIREKGIENNQSAVDFFSKGCDNGQADSCALGGSLVNSTVKDDDLSFSLYKKGCAMNHGSSCFHLAQFYKEGKGTPANLIAAADSYNKACNAGEGEACVNLGIMYIGGAGVVQNYKQAQIVLTRACDLKVGAGCAALGQMYEKGDGTEVDMQKARLFYKKGCELGFSSSCSR